MKGLMQWWSWDGRVRKPFNGLSCRTGKGLGRNQEMVRFPTFIDYSVVLMAGWLASQPVSERARLGWARHGFQKSGFGGCQESPHVFCVAAQPNFLELRRAQHLVCSLITRSSGPAHLGCQFCVTACGRVLDDFACHIFAAQFVCLFKFSTKPVCEQYNFGVLQLLHVGSICFQDCS